MNKIRITPAKLHGTIAAPPSKSHTHRLLAAAALSDAPSRIENAGVSADIEATAACLRTLGACVERDGADLLVTPIAGTHEDEPLVSSEAQKDAHGKAPVVPAGSHIKYTAGQPWVLDCGESGTTLRFMTPLAAALGGEVLITGSGLLNERPMEELLAAMAGHGVTVSSAHVPFKMTGCLKSGLYELPGNVSSQYISGLLFALPLLQGESGIRLTTPLSSSGYVAMTLDVLRRTGIIVGETAFGYRVPGGQRFRAPMEVRTEGDWSGSAFWLAAGALEGPVTVTGLDALSLHRDRQIADLLQQFGAEVSTEENKVTVRRGRLRGIRIDVDQIPDLALPLAAVAAFAEGETVLLNCSRLRLKESDRMEAIRAVLKGFGIRTELAGLRSDELHIFGGQPGRDRTGLQGDGSPQCIRGADSFHDHRVAMMAAILASGAEGPSEISDPDCVAKSYPNFFTDYRKLGGTADDI